MNEYTETRVSEAAVECLGFHYRMITSLVEVKTLREFIRKSKEKERSDVIQ